MHPFPSPLRFPALALTVTLIALVAASATQAQVTTGTVVEYVNQGDFTKTPGGQFFYSADTAEQLTVDRGNAGQFFRTGRTYAAGGGSPVCRFYGSVVPGPNSHFLTVDANECAGLKAAQVVPTPASVPQWNFEGNGFTTTATIKDATTGALTCAAGTTPVLRAYNNAFPGTGGKNPWDSNHRFTRSQADINAMVALGWKDEGAVFCAPTTPTLKQFRNSSALAGRCVAPRADPKYGDRPGTLTAEKAWVQSYVWETYLWYNELPDITPAPYSSPKAFFSADQTPGRTASGRLKDRFHFYYDTPVYEALDQGQAYGYGFEIAALSSSRPRKFVVAFTEPNSPAGVAGIGRGAQILAVDGEDLVNGTNVEKLNAGLFPVKLGETHTLTILDVGATSPRTVALVSSSVTVSPVQNVAVLDVAGGRVGYMAFHDHNLPAEAQLVAAMTQFQTAGVKDLVLDLRYNGGGYLFIASQLAYMIAGRTATSGKVMEKLTFSDKRSAETNDPNNRVPFYDSTSGYPGTGTVADAVLPTLDLRRVFVLTSGSTASASEAIINSLEGIDIQVIKVGTTTYGKPYGFSPRDNCDVTYFSVEFKGANNKGYGDYDDGFAPTCTVADDFEHVLGDVTEKRLAAALSYRATGVCPPASTSDALKSAPQEPQLFRSPLRENRLLLPQRDGLKRR